MARILIATDGFPSILYPSLELARRLSATGHQVTFAGAPTVRELAEHHDLGFIPLEASRYDGFLKADDRLGLLTRLITLRARRRQAAAAMAVTSFEAAARDLAPDLIVIDGEMHGHIIAASALGKPMAVLNSFASIWRRPGLPPAHCQVRPGVGWRGSRIGMELLWLTLGWRKRRLRWRQWWRRVGCDPVSVYRHLARQAGFDFERETDFGQWLIPFTYRHLPVLSLHAREFEFPHQPPEHVHYVGPMLLDSRIDRTLEAADRQQLDAIFGRRRSSDRQRLIYAGFGSTLTANPALLRRLLGIVEQRPDWQLVLSLSEQLRDGELAKPAELPERIHVFSWLPQREVLQHADVVISHGGVNTIDECVVAGVPMLIYCGGETDMAGNTARVVHHGLGLAGDPRRDASEQICQHLDRLLTEPSFEHQLQDFQRAYLAYSETRVAERVVEKLVGSPAKRDAE